MWEAHWPGSAFREGLRCGPRTGEAMRSYHSGRREFITPTRRRDCVQSKGEEVAMPTRQHIVPRLFAAIVFTSLDLGLAYAAPLMIVGNDEKLLWDDDGKRVLFPAG